MSYADSLHPKASHLSSGTGDAHAMNVAPMERAISALAGTALGLFALSRDRETEGMTRNALLVASTFLLYRGASGHCALYSALRTGTASHPDSPAAVIAHGQGVRVDKVVTIDAPVEKIYSYWRDFQNLPRFMKHLEHVVVTDETHSEWVAKAPLGQKVSWNAEVIVDEPNSRIAWRSVEPADIPNAGTVTFKAAPAGRGTIVEVTLEYSPPAGKLGATIAKLLGEEPGLQVEDDLRRFKQIMETGEISRNGHSPEDQAKKAEATA